MPNWTQEQYEKFLANSAAAPRRGKAEHSVQDSQPERPLPNEPLGSARREAACETRFYLRITSYRVRQLDYTNLVGGSKYVEDLCKMAGWIPEDNPTAVYSEFRQVKVSSKDEERTEIEVYPPGTPIASPRELR